MSRNIDNKLICTIDRFENSHIVLAFDLSGKKQYLNVPKRYLPKGSKESDVIHVKLLTDKQATLDQKEIAKNMLDEILNNNS